MYIYSNADFTRKVGTIRNWLRDKDFYYSDRMLTRVVTKIGGSGIYNRGVTTFHTDTVISGLIVYKGDMVSFDENAQSITSDAQFTCSINDKDTILNADEIWLDYDIPVYKGIITNNTFTNGYSGWTKLSGTITINSGNITLSASNSNPSLILKQVIPTRVSSIYTITTTSGSAYSSFNHLTIRVNDKNGISLTSGVCPKTFTATTSTSTVYVGLTASAAGQWVKIDTINAAVSTGSAVINGKRYMVEKDIPVIFGIDHIIDLTLMGKQNGQA
jgi:hypothetical protein